MLYIPAASPPALPAKATAQLPAPAPAPAPALVAATLASVARAPASVAHAASGAATITSFLLFSEHSFFSKPDLSKFASFSLGRNSILFELFYSERSGKASQV